LPRRRLPPLGCPHRRRCLGGRVTGQNILGRRLPEHQAVINRLGFNNLGVDALVRNVEKAKRNGILWIVPGTEANWLAPLEVKRIPGVGKVTENKVASFKFLRSIFCNFFVSISQNNRYL
jgi:hypothetical protein